MTLPTPHFFEDAQCCELVLEIFSSLCQGFWSGDVLGSSVSNAGNVCCVCTVGSMFPVRIVLGVVPIKFFLRREWLVSGFPSKKGPAYAKHFNDLPPPGACRVSGAALRNSIRETMRQLALRFGALLACRECTTKAHTRVCMKRRKKRCSFSRFSLLHR